MLGAMVGGRAVTRYVAALGKGIKNLRIGICEYFLHDLDPEVERAVLAAIEVLRAGGATVREVRLPEVEESHAFSGVISLSQAITYHDQTLKERPDRYGPSVRARLEAGYKLTAIDLVRAERRRASLVAACKRVFDEVDCLAGATIPAFANPIGEDRLVIRGRETTVLAEYPRLTSASNVTGMPAMSVPCGMGQNALPIGLQLMAAPRHEEVLFAIGAYYQNSTDHHRRLPPA
jgi:aspartyl-tRNA(Asn)/glutamyl-tRNA(Gln) amidotransferase subunit A